MCGGASSRSSGERTFAFQLRRSHSRGFLNCAVIDFGRWRADTGGDFARSMRKQDRAALGVAIVRMLIEPLRELQCGRMASSSAEGRSASVWWAFRCWWPAWRPDNDVRVAPLKLNSSRLRCGRRLEWSGAWVYALLIASRCSVGRCKMEVGGNLPVLEHERRFHRPASRRRFQVALVVFTEPMVAGCGRAVGARGVRGVGSRSRRCVRALRQTDLRRCDARVFAGAARAALALPLGSDVGVAVWFSAGPRSRRGSVAASPCDAASAAPAQLHRGTKPFPASILRLRRRRDSVRWGGSVEPAGVTSPHRPRRGDRRVPSGMCSHRRVEQRVS